MTLSCEWQYSHTGSETACSLYSASHCSLSLWVLEVCAGVSNLSGLEPGFLGYGLWDSLQAGVGCTHKLKWCWTGFDPVPQLTSGKTEVLHSDIWYRSYSEGFIVWKTKYATGIFFLSFFFHSEFLKRRCKPATCQEKV